MPSFGDVLAAGALVCGLATWLFPPLRIALSRRKRSSLAAVGFTIGVFVVTAYFSAAGLLLALLAFVFAEHARLGWFGLFAVVAFWLSIVMAMIYSDVRRWRRQPNETGER